MKRLLVIHYEYLNNYHSKNVGHFIGQAIKAGFRVDFLVPAGRAEPYDGRAGDRFRVVEVPVPSLDSWRFLWLLATSRERYEHVWLYPFYRRLPLVCLVLWLRGRRIILKMDSHRMVGDQRMSMTKLRAICGQLLVSLLASSVIVETREAEQDFIVKTRLIPFTLGLPAATIELIKGLGSIERARTLLYAGRICRAKGLDRLVRSFLALTEAGVIGPDWRLRIVGKVIEPDLRDEVMAMLAASSQGGRVVIVAEKTGQEYYREILASSLVVLPTRGEGVPNLLADAYFCRRLFLTTQGARCGEIIRDASLFCENSEPALRQALARVMNQIEDFYREYDRLYDGQQLVVSDALFARILS